jgi:orotate phosphoribosyltransferase-like protein
MPVDMSGPRASAAAYLLGDPFTILRPRVIDDGAGGTYPNPAGPTRIGPFLGGFRAANGHEAVVADQLVQRGSYRLKTLTELRDPATNALIVIAATDQIEVLGGVYKVVWTPPVAGLSLFRIVGLEEA